MNPMLQKLVDGWISPWRLRELGVLAMNRRNVDYIGRYNRRDCYPLVDDKLKTKLIAQKAGLMMPQLLFVVRAQHEVQHLSERLEGLCSFVIKPAQGSGGKGILVITEVRTAEDGSPRFVKSSGDELTIDAIERYVTNVLSGLHSLGGRVDVAIVEALVRVNPMFSELSYEGVPDIRLIVFKGYPVMGMLRLATEESAGKANLHQGAVGVGLNIANGQSMGAVQHDRPVRYHPDTGADLRQIRIPDWPTLLHLAARCYEVTELGYLGCDIVIDQALGPLLLELNARPGLAIQIANGCGLLPRLRAVEALDPFPVTVSERVLFATQRFGHTTNKDPDAAARVEAPGNGRRAAVEETVP